MTKLFKDSSLKAYFKTDNTVVTKKRNLCHFTCITNFFVDITVMIQTADYTPRDDPRGGISVLRAAREIAGHGGERGGNWTATDRRDRLHKD